MSRGTVQRRFFFEENIYFFISFVYWANFFSFWSKHFEQDCQNWSLRNHRKSWKKITFLEKNVGVFVFFRNEQRSFKISTNFFSRVVKTAFDVCIGSFWEVLFEKKSDIFILFAYWIKLFRHSVEVFPAEMSEKPSKFLINSWYWAFRQFFFGRFEKIAFCVSIDLFWREIFLKKKNSLSFLDKEQKKLGF